MPGLDCVQIAVVQFREALERFDALEVERQINLPRGCYTAGELADLLAARRDVCCAKAMLDRAQNLLIYERMQADDKPYGDLDP
jgi:hypothetical protein